jgi:hypothetical protein
MSLGTASLSPRTDRKKERKTEQEQIIRDKYTLYVSSAWVIAWKKREKDRNKERKVERKTERNTNKGNIE